jgi:hypothetical protein
MDASASGAYQFLGRFQVEPRVLEQRAKGHRVQAQRLDVLRIGGEVGPCLIHHA